MDKHRNITSSDNLKDVNIRETREQMLFVFDRALSKVSVSHETDEADKLYNRQLQIVLENEIKVYSKLLPKYIYSDGIVLEPLNVISDTFTVGVVGDDVFVKIYLLYGSVNQQTRIEEYYKMEWVFCIHKISKSMGVRLTQLLLHDVKKQFMSLN